MIDFLKTILEYLQGAFQAVVDSLAAAIHVVIHFFLGIWQWAWDLLRGTWDDVTEWLLDKWDRLKEWVDELLTDRFFDPVQDQIDLLTDTLQAYLEQLTVYFMPGIVIANGFVDLNFLVNVMSASLAVTVAAFLVKVVLKVIPTIY